eukprot:XP_001695803.1 predicted protein [Chlamydomonas reinhardtii]
MEDRCVSPIAAMAVGADAGGAAADTDGAGEEQVASLGAGLRRSNPGIPGAFAAVCATAVAEVWGDRQAEAGNRGSVATAGTVAPAPAVAGPLAEVDTNVQEGGRQPVGAAVVELDAWAKPQPRRLQQREREQQHEQQQRQAPGADKEYMPGVEAGSGPGCCSAAVLLRAGGSEEQRGGSASAGTPVGDMPAQLREAGAFAFPPPGTTGKPARASSGSAAARRWRHHAVPAVNGCGGGPGAGMPCGTPAGGAAAGRHEAAGAPCMVWPSAYQGRWQGSSGAGGGGAAAAAAPGAAGTARPGSVVSIRRTTPSVNNAYLHFHSVLEEGVDKMARQPDAVRAAAHAAAAAAGVSDDLAWREAAAAGGDWLAFDEDAWLRQLLALPGPTEGEREALEFEVGIVDMFLQELEERIDAVQEPPRRLLQAPAAARAEAAAAAAAAATAAAAAAVQPRVEASGGEGPLPAVAPQSEGRTQLQVMGLEGHTQEAGEQAVATAAATGEAEAAVQERSGRPSVPAAGVQMAAADTAVIAAAVLAGTVTGANEAVLVGPRPQLPLPLPLAPHAPQPPEEQWLPPPLIQQQQKQPLESSAQAVVSGPEALPAQQPQEQQLEAADVVMAADARSAEAEQAGPSCAAAALGAADGKAPCPPPSRKSALDVQHAAAVVPPPPPPLQHQHRVSPLHAATAAARQQDTGAAQAGARAKRQRTSAGASGGSACAASPTPAPTRLIEDAATAAGAAGPAPDAPGQPGAKLHQPQPHDLHQGQQGHGPAAKQQGAGGKGQQVPAASRRHVLKKKRSREARPQAAEFAGAGDGAAAGAEAGVPADTRAPDTAAGTAAGAATRVAAAGVTAAAPAAAGTAQAVPAAVNKAEARHGPAAAPRITSDPGSDSEEAARADGVPARRRRPPPPSKQHQQQPGAARAARRSAAVAVPAAAAGAAAASTPAVEAAEAAAALQQQELAEAGGGGAGRSRRGPARTSHWVVGTSLGADSGRLEELGARFKAVEVLPDVAPSMTHMVVRLRQDRRAEQRTLKYLRAAIRGVWVVGLAWVDACLVAGRLVPEAPFEATGDLYHTGTPALTRQMRVRGEPMSLFSGLSFCTAHCKDVGSSNLPQLEALLQEAGGTLVQRPLPRAAVTAAAAAAPGCCGGGAISHYSLLPLTGNYVVHGGKQAQTQPPALVLPLLQQPLHHQQEGAAQMTDNNTTGLT